MIEEYPTKNDTKEKIKLGLIIICIIAIGIITCIAIFGCINSQFGVVNKDATGQSNNGIVTNPKQTNDGNKTLTEGGDTIMYPEWEFIKVIVILMGLMMALTEVIGNIPIVSFISKKLLSILAILLAIGCYKLLSAHTWLYLSLMGGIAWYLGNSLWTDLVNGNLWKGWKKPKIV